MLTIVVVMMVMMIMTVMYDDGDVNSGDDGFDVDVDER